MQQLVVSLRKELEDLLPTEKMSQGSYVHIAIPKLQELIDNFRMLVESEEKEKEKAKLLDATFSEDPDRFSFVMTPTRETPSKGMPIRELSLKGSPADRKMKTPSTSSSKKRRLSLQTPKVKSVDTMTEELRKVRNMLSQGRYQC